MYRFYDVINSNNLYLNLYILVLFTTDMIMSLAIKQMRLRPSVEIQPGGRGGVSRVLCGEQEAYVSLRLYIGPLQSKTSQCSSGSSPGQYTVSSTVP